MCKLLLELATKTIYRLPESSLNIFALDFLPFYSLPGLK